MQRVSHATHTPNGGRLHPLSARAWAAWFRRNSEQPRRIPWEQPHALTESEVACLASSVPQFQLGEQGEGRHFLKVAASYAERSGAPDDADYITALKRFIAEENQHAADLGRILDIVGIPRQTHDAVDGVFRRLRHLAGLELTISVLLTAEIIATVYYAALRDATGWTVLRRVCEQILRDEAMHLRFQCERLARIRRNHGSGRCRCAVAAHRWLTCITCAVVWWQHRSVFRRAGFTFSTVRQRVMQAFHRTARLMDPAQYRFADVPIAESAARSAPESAVQFDARGRTQVSDLNAR